MDQLTTIPFVDMKGFLAGTWEEKVKIAHRFGKALQEIGFVAVTNAGIHAETVDNAYDVARDYFNLPIEEKLKQKSKDGFRGYVPFGQEHAKDAEHGDLKEFFHTTGPTQPHELRLNSEESILALYHELTNCLSICLEAITIYLGCGHDERNLLCRSLKDAGGLMRLLHYPPIGLTTDSNAVRSSAHEDIGVMTVIPRATEAGLQVKSREGEWIDVEVPSDAAIINAGDTLQHITAGQIPSTMHRVANNPGDRHRYSIPFFGNFPPEFPLEVLKPCRGNGIYPVIAYGEFMSGRYKKIGIKEEL